MKGFNHPLFNLTFCLILGIILQQYISFSLPKSAIFTGIAGFLSLILHFLFLKRKSIWLSLPLYVTFLSLGVLVTCVNNPLSKKDNFSTYNLENAAIYLRITEVLKPTSYATRYIGEAELVNGNRASGKLLLNVPRDSTSGNTSPEKPLRVDDLYALRTNVENVRSPRNPYQFDYSSYLADLGIYGQIYAENSKLLLIDTDIKSARGFAARIRSFFQERLPREVFAPREWGVLNALLLGQRQQLMAETRQNYIDAGVVHILAISGLHVGMILFILQLLFKPLGQF